MKGALNSVLDAMGNTPIVRLNKLANDVEANIFVKLEYLNPAGSIKDRPALQIIEDYEEEGKLREGGTIVEATSGNTGMGLAMAAAVKGYKTVFVMPDKMSQEKILALRAFGSRVVITPTNVEPEDPRSYYSVAARIVDETPGAVLANQYHNPSNPKAHVNTTGPEIWGQVGEEMDVLVATMGTGGTISGLGGYLKGKNPNLKIVGVDPVGSIYYDYFRTGRITTAHSYTVEGFGEDFLPSTMSFDVVDDIVRVTDKECFEWTRRMVREEGIYCGGSAGGAVKAAIRWAKQNPGKKNILVILPDSAVRYLSKIFDDNWMKENGYLEPEYGTDRVSDLLGKRGAIVSVDMDETVKSVVKLMRKHGISQLPVLSAGRVAGVVSESDFLDALTEQRGTLESPVKEFMTSDFSIVEPGNSTNVLGQLLAQDKTVIVEENGAPKGIVTKIDFIEYVARKGAK